MLLFRSGLNGSAKTPRARPRIAYPRLRGFFFARTTISRHCHSCGKLCVFLAIIVSAQRSLSAVAGEEAHARLAERYKGKLPARNFDPHVTLDRYEALCAIDERQLLEGA